MRSDPVHIPARAPVAMNCARAEKKSARRVNITALTLCAGLLVAFAITSWTAWLGKSATFDEPLHLVSAWVQTHHGDFRCNPEDPPLWKYYVAVGMRAGALPIIRNASWWPNMLRQMPSPAYFYSRHALFQTPGVDADGIIRAARARMLAIGMILGAAIGLWAWRLRGPLAACTALFLFCFDPNFLAHAALIKNDVPITAAFVLFMGAVWLLGESATAWLWLAVATLLGVCLTVKFSGILALPMLGLALLCRVLIPRPWRILKSTARTLGQRAGAAALIFFASLAFTYLFVWACYGFRFGPSPRSSVQFDFTDVVQTALTNEVGAELGSSQEGKPSEDLVRVHKPGPVIRFVLSANAHHLLPQPYLMGFLYTYSTSLVRKTFLCGKLRLSGFWYYFPLAMAFKTPLATLAAFAIGAILYAALLRGVSRQWLIANAWPICALAIAPIFYAIVAMRSNLNIGIRHILPIYPFLYIAVGAAVTISTKGWKKFRKTILAVLAAGLLLETLHAYPDFIPFFNGAAGGSRGGLALLSDSNIDWGQELPALVDWQRAHPRDQVYLFYFGVIDPHYYGLKYVEMAGSNEAAPGDAPDPRLRPVFAISAVALQGTYLSPEHAAFFARLRNQEPIAVLGGSIYLYDGVQASVPSPDPAASGGDESIH